VEWEHFEDTCEAVQKLQAQGYKVFAVEQVEGAVSLERFREAVVAAGTTLASDSKCSKSGKPSEVSASAETLGALPPIALVFGNEVDGVQQEVVDICDGAVEIPQWGTKHSLNVSVSIGVVLWELMR
jgi:tRNA G18 (ribose-2'-O)-methylase SpoU